MDPNHRPKPTHSPEPKAKAKPRPMNRHERRSLIARALTHAERKLLQLARDKARGMAQRRRENNAALELAQARELAARVAPDHGPEVVS
jgi:hypothetical protein